MSTEQHPIREMKALSGVRVHVRRARILIAAVLLVALVVALMWLCANDGIRLETFAAGDKDDDERSQLLDKYNSYSGNVASVIIKPLDYFVAMVVAVGVFTCATDASLGSNTSWVGHATMLVAAATGYLLSNGFNAVNVQLAPRPVELWITPADLSASAAASARPLTEKLQIKPVPFEATANKSLVEESERNPLTNTALRGLVESMQTIPNNQCTHFRGYTQSRWNSIVASYGFQQRAWHSNALREAMNPSAEIKFALRDTLSAKPQMLPMGTTRAMRLVTQSMLMTEKLLPWWEDKYSLYAVSRAADVAIKRKFDETLPRGVKRTNHSVTLSLNELLFNTSATGSSEGAAVLTSTQALLKTMFDEVKNISTPDVEVSFSRTNLSRSLYYDAITLEIPLVKQYLHRRLQLNSIGDDYRTIATSTSTTATVDAYYDIDIGAGCSTNGCIVEEKEYDVKGVETPIEAQVHASAVCANESIRVTYTENAQDAYFNSSFVSYDCSAVSNTSMYTVSLGKRIEGEEIALNAKDAGLVTLKNARKVYSITVGMLTWEPENLADAYGATCGGGDATQCSGLRFELDSTDGSPKQHLLASASRVPTSLLPEPAVYKPSLVKLTQLVSIAPTQICATCKGLVADMVFPRRFKTTNMEIDQLLRDLARLDDDATRGSSADASAGVPDALRRFAVVAASPLAPDSMDIVATDPMRATPAPIFSTPALSSPFADPSASRRELEQHTHPQYALEHLSPYATGGFVFPEPRASRFLAQVPMAPARKELVPNRRGMVLDPLNLTYEFRAIDTSRAGADAGFSSALTKQDEYARGKMTNKPFSPGGESLVALDEQHGDSAVAALWTSPAEQTRNVLVLSGTVDVRDAAALEELVLRAPGLDGALTLDDVRKIETRRPVTASTSSVESSPSKSIDVVGTNPTGLLQPYFHVASDRQHVEAVRRVVVDQKVTRAMALADTESGTLALDELLHDLEDDDDLGFFVEDADDDGGDAAATLDSEGDETKQSPGDETASSAEPASQDDSASREPEVELEAILSADANPKPATAASTAPVSEWASLASVDVRNFHDKVPEMAISYDFELDTFQKECVIHLERHECVFVAAHTSAGKTVVAEYAIAMSQKHLTRTIYTSPIKALSNQKYRDFRTKFGPENVGLITGDVSINPEASCLVMTTEILRSMLYRGADVIRDIEWVIFDEIHYINDSERGVVWEEVIIMLPEHIGMVFLSATTPNHLEFSDWIGRTKKKKIHVISTTKRPVPLQHFLYAGKELFKLYDATHGYLPGAYSAAKAKLFPPSDKPKAGGRGGGSAPASSGSSRNMGRTSGGDQSDWTKLITSLKDKALLPVVVFAFSKRLCEESASKLSKLDLSTPSERSEIHLFLEASIQRLQGSDRELPQVLTMKEMLKRGIGVHHGGLLPIIKEMVEILFGRGLVKVLFSTETFAMGVNMPARTVVFNGIRKHDGKSFRDLLPGEYTQMAGRAGRRGLDLVGTVIISCWNDVPEPTSLQTMLAGKATSLSSQFRLTYNMILNLLRVEVLTVEDMMKRSFSEFQTQKALASKNIPQLIVRGRKLLKRLDAALRDEYPHLESSGELAQIRELYSLKKHKREVERRLTKWLLTKSAAAARTAIAPGRVVLINAKGLPSDVLALVVRTNSNPNASGTDDLLLALESDASNAQGLFKSITVLFLCADDYTPPPKSSAPAAGAKQSSRSAKASPLDFGGRQLRGKRDDADRMFGGTARGGGKAAEANELESNTVETLLGKRYAVLDIPETCVDVVTDLTAAHVNFKTLVAASSKKELASSVEFLTDVEAANAQRAHVAFVDIVNELKLKTLDVVTLFSDWQQLQQRVLTHVCTTGASSLSRVLGKVEKIAKLEDYVARLTRELSNDSLSLFPDFQQRLQVLKRLGYISDDGVVQVKGRVACEINTCEEIVLTEMIFENVLANLEPEEIVAVLSALIFQEKTQSEPTLTPRLDEAREVVKRIAESLGLIQLEQHLEIDPAVYCKGALNFGLMEVVYEWSRGMPFKELCLLTDIQEGSIVRCITRLDEVCREVRNAARVIGDPGLFRKMEVASESIKRDVVFASSLYLT